MIFDHMAANPFDHSTGDRKSLRQIFVIPHSMNVLIFFCLTRPLLTSDFIAKMRTCLRQPPAMACGLKSRRQDRTCCSRLASSATTPNWKGNSADTGANEGITIEDNWPFLACFGVLAAKMGDAIGNF